MTIARIPILLTCLIADKDRCLPSAFFVRFAVAPGDVYALVCHGGFAMVDNMLIFVII